MLRYRPGVFFIISLLSGILLFCFSDDVSAQSRSGAPTVQDCLGAIPVCQPVYTTTSSYTGHGNVYPEIRANSNCPLCMDGEKNDVFYVITVQTSGLLRFTLTPNNPSNDYDWSLFNMTNAGCDEIYTHASTLQVSCNSYGVQGTNGPTGINTLLGNNLNCNGPGTIGEKFNKDLTVHAGETYVLNVSNWSSTNQSGYTLDFTGSSASIYDATPAVIDSIGEQVPCDGTDSLYIAFSENIRCEDVYQHPEKFSLTGPAGTYTIIAALSPDCETGAANGRNCILKVSPNAGAGSYILSIVGDIRDLCDNVCLYQGYPFQLSEINAPLASAGNDTTVANGAVITLHGSASGGTLPYSYHWEPAAYLVNPNVATPLTTNLGASVNFTVTVTDSHGCHGTDGVLVTVAGGPLGVTALADPGTICAGEQSLLDALVSGGSGNYSYHWSSDPPGFTSTLKNPVVYPQTTTQYIVQAGDGFSTITGNTTVNVDPLPVASAGSNTSVPFGTSVALTGSASGGSGNYSFSWSSTPPGYSSSMPSPLFANLSQTTLFHLVVTDNATGCQSEPSQVTVTVTGSPLACQPLASPPVICRGTAVTLHSMAGGGSGNYTYAWNSVPPGFTSTLADPVVTPVETTVYALTLNDGFNAVSGHVTVSVKTVPVFPGWHHDTTVCIYEKVTLDAGNPGAAYYWSNGATGQILTAQSTGIGYDVQHYRVVVTNEEGCSDSAFATIEFSFSACMGVEERAQDEWLRIIPNPAGEQVRFEFRGSGQAPVVRLITMSGVTVHTGVMKPRGDGISDYTCRLSGISPGLYIVALCCDNSIHRRKLVVRQP